MKFIDEVTIQAKAGNGGPGARHFRREKFVPLGGPDGGNGGSGGSIIFKATKDKNTLLDYSFKRNWQADNGEAGGKQLSDGAGGEDVILLVPVGTEIYKLGDDGSEELVNDLSNDGDEYTALQGGKGGKGNAFFKSPTQRAPEHSQPGLPGEEGSFRLSLKLLADVGLVGLPNAGKSTFISSVSAAKPKIADYPFTTLTPHLGVVKVNGGGSYTIADVPGLIPGAHEGKGLGRDFLKHLERTKLLLHLVDASAPYDQQEDIKSPLEAYRLIEKELRAFSPELADRECAVVLTKIDVVPEPEIIEQYKSAFTDLGLTCFALSSATKAGVSDCLNFIARKM